MGVRQATIGVELQSFRYRQGGVSLIQFDDDEITIFAPLRYSRLIATHRRMHYTTLSLASQAAPPGGKIVAMDSEATNFHYRRVLNREKGDALKVSMVAVSKSNSVVICI